MKRLNNKIIIFLICFIYFSNYLNTRTYVLEMSTNLGNNIDSTFIYFEKPKLSIFFKERDSSNFKGWDITIVCNAIVGSDNMTKELTCYPLYNLGNDLDSSVVNEICDSLKSISKKWIWRPLFFHIDSSYSQETKKYFSDINNTIEKEGKLAKLRPFSGQQINLIIFHFKLAGDLYTPTQLIWINIDD